MGAGEKQERKISSLASWNNGVFTTCGPTILRWYRGKLQETYTGHTADVYLLFTYGDVLISISKDRCMKVWHLTDIGNANE